MTFMAIFSALALQSIGVPTPAPPLPPPPPRQYVSFGIGATLCSEWTASRETSVKPRFNAWLEGYLTALNAHGPNLVTRTAEGELDVAQKSMANHCADYPERTIGWAADQASQDVRMGMKPAR
jgi:hypothetical protein